MKRKLTFLLCIILVLSVLTGCGRPGSINNDTIPNTAETDDEHPDDTVSHYTFKPKVCSSYQEAVYGKTMCDTWYNLVDAVMAGEDHFVCPDTNTYDWVMGQFPNHNFPVLIELIDYAYDRDHSVVNGVAKFEYLVPKEEAALRIAEFAALIEDILNTTLRDDFSDFEKVLALYRYFSFNYEYDYEAAKAPAFRDDLSSYRALTTKKGICGELSSAFSYLLMQAGVDASVMGGESSWGQALHQWSYVRINGHNFHVDPTYVIADVNSLSYLMMDDEQRKNEDGYDPKHCVIESNYAQDHPHPDYKADDDSFREIWKGYIKYFDPYENILYYEVDNGQSSMADLQFDYTGW